MSINPFDAPTHDNEHSSYLPTEPSEILFGFQGRISRTDYWTYGIASAVIFFMLVFALSLLFGPESDATTILTLLLYFPLAWISLALQAKRWHDRGYSGWMVLIGFVPIIGPIWSFVEVGLLRGTEGPNAYGADPT